MALAQAHAKEFQWPQGSFVKITIPVIKILYKEKDWLTVGNFVMQASEIKPGTENNEKPEYDTKMYDLGINPEVVVFRSRYKYSYYSNKANWGKWWMVFDCSEFDSRNKNQLIHTWDKWVYAWPVAYDELMRLRNEVYVSTDNATGYTTKNLSYQEVLYVEIKHPTTKKPMIAKIYCMVSSIVWQQIDASWKASYDFDNPLPWALKAFQNSMQGFAPYSKYCQLGREHVSAWEIDYWRVTFKPTEDTPMGEYIDKRDWLDKDIVELDKAVIDISVHKLVEKAREDKDWKESSKFTPAQKEVIENYFKAKAEKEKPEDRPQVESPSAPTTNVNVFEQ